MREGKFKFILRVRYIFYIKNKSLYKISIANFDDINLILKISILKLKNDNQKLFKFLLYQLAK